jgi:zinc protease
MSLPKRKQPPLNPFTAFNAGKVNLLSLRNSVPVYTIEAGTEDVMRIEFIFRAGIDKEYIPLLATTTNMMLTEGSLRHTSEEITRLLDYYGVFLNLSAEKDNAGLIAYFLSRHIKKVLELIREILFEPAFPEKELNILMRKRLRWFMINRERVQNIAMEKFFESIFGSGHPYGHMVQESDFEGLHPAVLRDFHSKYYDPSGMTVIVSGRIPMNTANLLRENFGSLRSGNVYTEEFTPELKGEQQKKSRIGKEGAVQSAIRIGSPTINKRHPDYPGLKILNVILGGYFGSRLMRNIREDKGYTYGISSLVTSLDLSGFKVISTEVAKDKTDLAVDEIYREIRLLQEKPVERDELEIVRNYMSGDLLRMFDGPFALAESFKSAWEFGLDNSYYEAFAEKIKTISPDEIRSLANTYYKIDDLYEIIAG